MGSRSPRAARDPPIFNQTLIKIRLLSIKKAPKTPRHRITLASKLDHYEFAITVSWPDVAELESDWMHFGGTAALIHVLMYRYMLHIYSISS